MKKQDKTKFYSFGVVIILALFIGVGIYFWQRSVFRDDHLDINGNRASQASIVIERSKGYLLLHDGNPNLAWYVYPQTGERFFLGLPERGIAVMHKLATSISSTDLAKLPLADSGQAGDPSFQQQKAGYVLVQSEPKTANWYIAPQNLQRYYLTSPQDLAHLIARFGVAASTADLEAIPLATKFPETVVRTPTSGQSSYQQKSIQTKRGAFTIDLITIDLSGGNIDLITTTAAKTDCYSNCPAAALADFVKAHNGFAGIHGAYFCPPDYGHCQSQINYYFFPFYETTTGYLVNAGQVKWLQGSILVFDKNYNHYLFVDGREFKSVTEFEAKYGVKIQALASNSPTMIQNGQNIVATQRMDDKQRTTRGYRGGIGVRGKTVYLVIARSATVPDLASVFEALGVTTALNLDGGGSSALYWHGQYKIGPGRRLPTGIVIKAK